MSKTVVAFGVCGSFCTFENTLVQMERLRAILTPDTEQKNHCTSCGR